jgi:hypothetical protein
MQDQPGFWDSLSVGLGIGASAAALIAAAAGAAAFGIRQWRRTVGRRHTQTAILDQLACGSGLPFVEARLGLPKYITGPGEGPGAAEERIYRLPGAWVTVQAPNGVVTAFSITITDPKMYYDTAPLTLGAVAVLLGRSSFADAPPSDSESVEIYARHATFVRFYDYGSTAAGNQYIWLAFNEIGAIGGVDAMAGIGGSGNFNGEYGTGAYSSGGGKNAQSAPPDMSTIAVNTITVATYGHRDEIVTRGLHGPHPDTVRRG